MKNLALARIQAMQPYNPPLAGRRSYDGLLLDFNERTLPPGPIWPDDLQPQLYPEYGDLTASIAAYAGVRSRQVMITNGTDQAIDVVFRTFADVHDKVIIPQPSFAMFRQTAQVNGNRIVSPRYSGGDLAFPTKAVLRATDAETKLIVICNPNNPTGTLASLQDIETIAARASTAMVYIDEAYFEFSQQTAVGLLAAYPNIVISRTFSKAFGLAGLRIGYLIANERYINEMLKVRGPYDINQPACAAATAALADSVAMDQYAGEVMDQAKPLVERFFRQQGIEFYPSAGNFILFRPPGAAVVAAALRQAGMLVRPQTQPDIADTLRLTVGTVPQMRQFIKTYQEAVLRPQKYALLDRDGTLIYEPPDDSQIDSLDKLRLLDGVIEGLGTLQQRGYKLVMVSNQDGLGSKAFPAESFEAPQRALLAELQAAGISFEQIFICSHRPADACACRKPRTGLVDGFLQTVRLDAGSFVCGDRASDKGFAKRLGLPFVPMPKNGNFYQALGPFLKGARS